MGSHSTLYDFIGISQPGLSDILSSGNENNDDLSFAIKESHYYDLDAMSSFISCDSNFTILSLDIQSLKLKWNVLSSMLDLLRCSNINFSALLFQETWLDDDT